MRLSRFGKKRSLKAVSPVVATLILIIVAIVGAVAVGLIVSGIGTQTSKNANVAGSASGAQSEIIVGGSTTLFPAVEAGAVAYSAANGLKINVTQGGSGAGMTGVALGVLDIGDASSFSAVSSAITQFPSDDLQAFEVGGSGVVFIANAIPTSVTCTTVPNGITLSALQTLFTTGSGVPVCTTVAAGEWLTSFTAGAGVTAVSRADLPSGTEDTACAYLNTGANVCASTSNNAVALAGKTETGNPGVLSTVESTPGTIGFVDLGFAEGAATTPGSTTAQTNILQVTSNATITVTGGSVNPLVDCATNAKVVNCYALKGESTAELHAFIKNGLSQSTGSAASPTYPDQGLSSTTTIPTTGLTRTFWMVTKGSPDTSAQSFITFMQSPANTGYWHSAGYFSIYDISPITPP